MLEQIHMEQGAWSHAINSLITLQLTTSYFFLHDNPTIFITSLTFMMGIKPIKKKSDAFNFFGSINQTQI